MFKDDLDDQLDKEALPDENAKAPINDENLTEPDIGADNLGTGLNEEDGTAVYPVPDDKHIGISTDNGTPPESTDQIDEANDAILWGTPDDPFTEDVFPSAEKNDNEAS